MTKLLVSGRSPECSDCLSRFMEQYSIKKLNEMKQNENKFFSKI